jgi:RND family efflux transporter MFP subunit
VFYWLKKNALKIIIIIVVIIIIFVINSYLQMTKPVPKVKIQKENEITVNSLVAKLEDHEPFLSAFGRVKTQRIGNLSFGVSGTISYLSDKFVNGGKVKKGEILGKLDEEKFLLIVQRLQADIKELTKQIELRKKQLDRNKIMLEKKVISPSVYDEELIKYSKSQQMLNNSKINLGLAKKDLKDATLIAKSNGIISNVNAHEGLLVSSNSMLGTFRSLDHVEIEFIVPAKIFSISKKLIGKKIEVYWETGSEKLVRKNAIITRFQGIINDDSGGGKIFAKFSDDKNDLIPLDSFVKIIYPLEKFDSVIKIPESALFNKQFIFVIENGRAKKIKVKVIHSNTGYYLLKNDDLDGLDIILNRFSSNIEGTKIKQY